MILIAVGACAIDTILTVPFFPGEDTKLRATTLVHRRGGNCPNTLEVLSQLFRTRVSTEGEAAQSRIKSYLISALPARESTAIETIRLSLGDDVDLRYCLYREAETQPVSSYIMKSAQTGSRTIVNYNQLEEMSVNEFAVAVGGILGHAGGGGSTGQEEVWVHFEGRVPETTLQCIMFLRGMRQKLNRTRKIMVSVEVEKPGREGLQELANEADVVFYSKVWAQNEGYTNAEECLRAQAGLVTSAELLVCAWGEAGAGALRMNRSTGKAEILELVNEPAFDGVKEVVDTVGAGDTFLAGILYSLLYRRDDWLLRQKLKFANELAGRKIGQEGFDNLGNAMRDIL